MAANTRSEVEERWSLQDAVGEIDGWQVLGGSRLKKLEITVFQSTFDAIRSYLQGLALSGLAVSEVYLWGKPGQRSNFYRGAQYDAPSPRVKLEMLIDEDSVSDVLTMVSGHERSAGDGVASRAVVSDAEAAVCAWPRATGSRSL